MSEKATPRTEALLRDALDHIKRVAYEGVQPTRRLDWIALRAKVALRGDTWEPGMRDEPDNSRAELIEKNMKLREKLSATNARIAELEKDAERWRTHIRLMRRRHSEQEIDKSIAVVNAAMSAKAEEGKP